MHCHSTCQDGPGLRIPMRSERKRVSQCPCSDQAAAASPDAGISACRIPIAIFPVDAFCHQSAIEKGGVPFCRPDGLKHFDAEL